MIFPSIKAADAIGIASLRAIAPHVKATGTQASRLVTDTLHVRRDGRWKPLLA